jgi:hypothetical protein
VWVVYSSKMLVLMLCFIPFSFDYTGGGAHMPRLSEHTEIKTKQSAASHSAEKHSLASINTIPSTRRMLVPGNKMIAPSRRGLVPGNLVIEHS